MNLYPISIALLFFSFLKIFADTSEKILRLHFNPAPYKGFKRFKDLFTVEAGPFTLLSNFSASLTADALGVDSFTKEFCINIQKNQDLNIIFSPENSQSYAFINGIEIIPVPTSLSYFNGGDVNGGVLLVVGEKSLVHVHNSNALEIIHQQNVKQDSDSSTSGMFGMWEMVNNRKAKNITWRVSVDVGFRYLIRLHFSKLGFKMTENAGLMFKVYINEMIANINNIGTVSEHIEDNSIPCFRDYIVMIKGRKHEGKHNLLICLQSNDEFVDGYGPIKGFEIMKLSNLENSLASPNPLPSTRDSLHGTIQNLLRVLGHRNVIATVAIAILALVNIVIHTLVQIREASCTEEENKPSARAEQLCRRFSLAELQLATRDFSDAHLIGRGEFGKVYKGLIDNGQKTMAVAIKRLKSNSNQGPREFLTEIETLTELRHVNLVSLIGYCIKHREMILVYEYIACGTLADHLYKLARNNENSSSLTWKQRLNICIGAGRGLDYLHTGHSLIHRDVKPSNILLDENFIAKVSDFGLAKHENISKLESHVSTNVKGTFGYLDPHYFTTRKLTRKSDTYSFGVVLFEVLCGRPAFDTRVAEDERILANWAREKINKGKIGEIVASNLRGEISIDSLKAFVGIAEKCLHEEPKKRPTMAQVVLQLEFALEQQDRIKSLVPNRITSHLGDDIRNETNLPVNNGQLRMASKDVQNLAPATFANNKVLTAKPSGRKDKPSRFWLWDVFWKRVKTPTKNELLLSGNPAAYLTTETAQTDKQMDEQTDKQMDEHTDKQMDEQMDKQTDEQTITMQPINVPVIPVDELKDITDNFGSKSFNGERSYGKVSKMPNAKHENVVELLGYCVDGGLRVLAYEYAPHGSLHDILHGIKGAQPGPALSWSQRVKIAVGAAKGLRYLHEEAQPCIIHSDLMSSNVMLFDDDVAKITGFELSNQISYMEARLLSPRALGIFGYQAPEYMMADQKSFKSDVYSFGVVLLELLTGRKPIDITRPRGQQSLVTCATPMLSQDKVNQCVDPRLNGEYPLKAVAKMAAIAAMCIQHEAEFRPSMSLVVIALRPLLNAQSRTPTETPNL
ncbi:hypothetical protein BUALT_Bualt07G0012000 [Buddleja alternifolia]|uniref:Protein kinase domain-containing protein n=1 Tax=Buddleja alternifolia TaxID=168488 RepID=A0AAV6XB97_9LAMI|nr:hypothetical protein BUALT_Bualt07G0012000 [Buddleja alternifolia]